ncbi:desmocollin 2-like protein [Xiphophorus couchianus]|uniref:desmocollin 2-like protein n=1 Tax=Xiphophorus couchianus TaxID=32473 RepID=UPI0010166441|nr:desmocollin-2-like [Xiphophorus couchianus]
MTKVLIYPVLSLLILSCVESCYIPDSLHVVSPQNIPVGYQITKVEAVGCDPKTLRLTVEDPSFTIQSNGAIVALSPVSVATRGRTFSVRAQDNSGPESEMEVHLVCSTKQETNENGQVILKRTKRRWSPPPINILENDIGSFPKSLEKIVSDSEAKHNVYYTIEGPGVNLDPSGIFSLDSASGVLKVHRTLDREMIAQYTLRINALDKVSHEPRDLPLDIVVKVDDVNDNAPVFQGKLEFSVLEQTLAEVVGKVNATDKDDPETDHVRIRYKLINGLDFFAINAETGVITTISKNLDRETKDIHLVTIEIRDLKGAPTGLSNTATATITLKDINDNPPTFTQSSYKTTVPENEGEKLLLRIPVKDKDLINTPNWVSKFVITKGNENGNFRIDTDPKTNDGLLYVTKPLDYEKTKNVMLEISAQNQEKLVGASTNWMSIPVEVAVTDIDEGPEFLPPTVRYTVKENIPNGTVIGTYKATDPETKSSDGILYYKVSDPGSWVGVNSNTGELTVTNTIDRESPLVQDGIYNITVKAVDATSKSGTGTVILVIEDENDNKPTIPNKLTMCKKPDGSLNSLVVVAQDNDLSPFSSPFSYSMPAKHDGNWDVSPYNGTAAQLMQRKELPLGFYKVSFIVKDLQGIGDTQTTTVRICQCMNGACIKKGRSIELGPLGILTLLLPLFLLLLLCLLMFSSCTTKSEKVPLDDKGFSSGILLPSNTEAPGDEVDSSAFTSTSFEQAVKGSVKGTLMSPGWPGNKSTSTIGGHSVHENGFQQSFGLNTMNTHNMSSSQFDQYGQHVESKHLRNGMDSDQYIKDNALYRTWLTHDLYLKKKLAHMGRERDERYASDVMHSYDYEGNESFHGSVGCCSEQGDKENLDFLNTLGPKFKTLGEVCTKR